MGRHTVVNPSTGRSVFKTGAIGRRLSKSNAAKPKTKPSKSCGRCYASTGATKRRSPLIKRTKSGAARPSARAMYDIGDFRPVVYDGKIHIMKFRGNGSPYYKAL